MLSVILFHGLLVGKETLVDRALFRIREPLWCGVDLFFVLYGFLITGILLETRRSSHYFRNFMARRMLRIFPLYYGVLVGLFVLLPIAATFIPRLSRLLEGDYYSALWENQVWLWTYLQNFLQAQGPHRLPGLGHFWTLAIEEQFYLVWPLIVFLLPPRHLLWTCVFGCSVVCVLRPILLANGVDEWAVRHFTFTRIDTMLYGAIAAVVIREPGLLAMATRHSRKIISLLLAVIAMTAWFADGLAFGNRLIQIFVYPSLGMAFALGIMLAASRDLHGMPVQQLSGRFLTTLGKYSYAMYVFHWPIVHLARAIVNRLFIPPRIVPYEAFDSVLITILTIAITLPLSMLSWSLYERRWLSLKRYVSYDDVRVDVESTSAPEASHDSSGHSKSATRADSASVAMSKSTP